MVKHRQSPPKLDGMALKRRRAWQNMLVYARNHRLNVYHAWLKYDGFIHDVGLPLSKDYRLQRLKSADGFEPGNVDWVRTW